METVAIFNLFSMIRFKKLPSSGCFVNLGKENVKKMYIEII